MKKVISFLLAAVLLMGMMSVSVFAASNEFAGGSGTESDPYLISTTAHLNNVRNHLNAYFKMTNDIVFAESDYETGGKFYNSGAFFAPIGANYDNAFTGVFDGNGYCVKNLLINISSTQSVYNGLFGYNKGTIKNLSVEEGIYLSQTTYADTCAGGIAGYNAGKIEKCYNNSIIMVVGGYGCYVGGITGYNNDGTVSQCYNSGIAYANSLYDNAFVGGIVGNNLNIITDCYNVGTVLAESPKEFAFAGGITGEDFYGTINQCYNSSDMVLASGAHRTCIGGILGQSSSTTFQNCYYADNLEKGCGNGTDAAVKCTLEQMAQQSTFVGFDFDNVWTFNTDVQPYPILKGMHYHTYADVCDETCNTCTFTRTAPHDFGEYVYNNDATEKKDGTQTSTCSLCGATDTITAEGTKWKNPFKDIKRSDFYYTPVLWAVNKGITTGTSNTTFSPNDACTRGQIATFLWRAAGSPTPKTNKNPFTDVKKKDYYYKAVLWAVGKGITSGTSKTTFSPNDPCTRGQIAAFLYRAASSPKPKTNKNPFTDIKPKDYYYNAVLWAVGNGITAGTSKTTFSPNDPCTRGQIATFLYRYYN